MLIITFNTEVSNLQAVCKTQLRLQRKGLHTQGPAYLNRSPWAQTEMLFIAFTETWKTIY